VAYFRFVSLNLVLQVRWGECSLRNGFGLKFLHRFFNVPFLTLQRQSLLQQLEVNRRDILATQEELDVYMESDEANYQLFSDNLNNKRRVAAEQAAPPPSASIVAGQPSNTVDLNKKQPSFSSNAQLSFSNRTSSTIPVTKSPGVNKSPIGKAAVVGSVKVDVDNFVPDESDFDTFLEEGDSLKERSVSAANNIDSSDDDEGANPMVSKFDDEVDVDTYDPVIDVGPRDESDDSDLDNSFSSKTNKVVQPKVIKELVVPEVITPKETIDDDFESFLNENECDNTVKSLHTDYETL